MREKSLSRRGLLTAVGWMGLGSVAACAAPSTPAAPPPAPIPQAAADPVVLGGDMPTVRHEVVRSGARGTDVRLMTAVPSGADIEDLPMVLYLHGRDGMDPTPFPDDTLLALNREHRDGTIPAFGIVAVEGGYNPYWYDGSANGDLMSMLLREVPGWMTGLGFHYDEGRPFATAGISTGGFGALNYAIERQREDAPVSAVGLLAPAVPLTWQEMREKNVFASEQEWVENDPLQRLDGLGEVPVGMWVGDADVFKAATDRVAEEYDNVPVFSVLPGGHDASVFDVVGTDMVRFLATGVSTLG